jgi:ribonuclease ZC3H12
MEEVEILTVKITPNGSKKVKGPGQGKKNNPQAIFSKFNLPNPVFPKDENFIPIAGHDEKVQRQVRNRTGYKFDPNAPANTNFTRSVGQMRGKVYQFKGSWSSIGSHGNKRRPTMGLNQLHASSRPKLQPNPKSKANITPASFDNVHVPDVRSPEKEGTLRTIVIDGQNVAVEHAKANGGLVIFNHNQGSSSGGAAPRFSCDGIRICVDYFKKRGHKDVIAFVPQFRQKRSQSDKPEILERLNAEGILTFTPCKQIDGKAYNSYDDRFIVQCAALKNAVIISNDNYRDLAIEDAKMKNVIDNHVLKFVWVGDTLMFSQDPLGKNGPSLEEFLKH